VLVDGAAEVEEVAIDVGPGVDGGSKGGIHELLEMRQKVGAWQRLWWEAREAAVE
jgi:hypothetical protein